MSGGRGRPMTCDDCGATTLRRSPSQRYCATCSAARDSARKAKWQSANPRSAPRPYPEIQSAMVQAGARRSCGSRASVGWSASEEIDAHTMARVVVPFDWVVSKNGIFAPGRGGHVYLRSAARAKRDEIIFRLRSHQARWFQGRVWLDIFVEKPSHRGDAVNVVDLVCDAVKEGIGVDDRWFSIARLDWSIVKENPRLIIGVRQAITEDYQVCSHCGRDLPLASSFGRNRSTKTGFTRVCRDCSAPKRVQEAAA